MRVVVSLGFILSKFNQKGVTACVTPFLIQLSHLTYFFPPLFAFFASITSFAAKRFGDL
jgi:hypothetical protein